VDRGYHVSEEPTLARLPAAYRLDQSESRDLLDVVEFDAAPTVAAGDRGRSGQAGQDEGLLGVPQSEFVPGFPRGDKRRYLLVKLHVASISAVRWNSVFCHVHHRRLSGETAHE
jgi:hypothetical protein